MPAGQPPLRREGRAGLTAASSLPCTPSQTSPFPPTPLLYPPWQGKKAGEGKEAASLPPGACSLPPPAGRALSTLAPMSLLPPILSLFPQRQNQVGLSLPGGSWDGCGEISAGRLLLGQSPWQQASHLQSPKCCTWGLLSQRKPWPPHPCHQLGLLSWPPSIGPGHGYLIVQY